jgi:hypothetical protein
MTPAPIPTSRRIAAPPAGQLAPRALAFGVLGAPLACATAFLLNLFVLRERCAGAAVTTRLALVVLAGLVSAAAAAVAWRSWQTVRDEVPPATGGAAGRNRFLALLGLAASGMGVLLSLGFLAVVLVLDPCQAT